MSERPSIDQVIERIGLLKGLDPKVSELHGGLTNQNYLVEADGAKYVVRIPGVATELLAVDRVNERENAAAAATTGVSPRILEYLPDLSVMVLEYIDGKTMSGEESPGRRHGRAHGRVAPATACGSAVPSGLQHVPAGRVLPDDRRAARRADP